MSKTLGQKWLEADQALRSEFVRIVGEGDHTWSDLRVEDVEISSAPADEGLPRRSQTLGLRVVVTINQSGEGQSGRVDRIVERYGSALRAIGVNDVVEMVADSAFTDELPARATKAP